MKVRGSSYRPVSKPAPKSKTSPKSNSSAKASKSSTTSKPGKTKVSKSDTSTKAPKTTVTTKTNTVKMTDASSSKKSSNKKSSQEVVNIGQKEYNASIGAAVKTVAGIMAAGVGSTIRIGAAVAAGETEKTGTGVKTSNGKVSTVPQNTNSSITVSRTSEIVAEVVPKAVNTATATAKVAEMIKAGAVAGVTVAVKNEKTPVVTKDTKSSAVITRDTKEEASIIKEVINVALAVSNTGEMIKAGAVLAAGEVAAKTAGTVVLQDKKQGVKSGYQKRDNGKKEEPKIERNQENSSFGISFGPLFSPDIMIGGPAIGLHGIPGLIGIRTPSYTKSTIPGGLGGPRSGYYMLHPPGERKAYKVTKDDVHAMLNGLAMIPGLGDIADVMDAAIYLSEGKVGKAAEKLFWVVIGLDEISDARKLLGYMNEAVEEAGDFREGIKAVKNVLKKKFGKEVLEEATEEAVESAIKSGSGSKFKDVFDLADNYNLSDDAFNNHILDRHGPNSIYGNKSHFNADFDIKKGIDSTLKGDNFIIKSNTAGRDGYIFEQTFIDPIGTSNKGKPLYTIKVVIDEYGNVVTAFPKK